MQPERVKKGKHSSPNGYPQDKLCNCCCQDHCTWSNLGHSQHRIGYHSAEKQVKMCRVQDLDCKDWIVQQLQRNDSTHKEESIFACVADSTSNLA